MAGPVNRRAMNPEAKVSSRELRRQLQQHAGAIHGLGSAVGQDVERIANKLQAIQQILADQGGEINGLRLGAAGQASELTALRARLEAFEQATFGQRLCWLLCGRQPNGRTADRTSDVSGATGESRG